MNTPEQVPVIKPKTDKQKAGEIASDVRGIFVESQRLGKDAPTAKKPGLDEYDDEGSAEGEED